MKWHLTALVLWAGLAVVATRAEDTPKLQLEKTTSDFGTASEGAEITGKFLFHNAGKGVLKIGTPETSCGCTVASVKPDTLPPGETGEIAFRLDLTDARGPVKKTITVPSNDPQQPKLLLIISGNVEAVFDVSPPMVFFGDVPPGETARETIEIRRLDGKKLSVTRAETSREYLKTSVQPDTNSDSEAVLVVEATGTGRPEQFSDILSVILDKSSKPAFHIPVAGQFVASIVVEPAALQWTVPDPAHWPGPDPAVAPTRKITISSTVTNRTLKLVESVSSFDEDLLIKVEQLEPGQKFEVTVKLAEPFQESKQGSLTFVTNFPDFPSVIVPIQITVSKP